MSTTPSEQLTALMLPQPLWHSFSMRINILQAIRKRGQSSSKSLGNGEKPILAILGGAKVSQKSPSLKIS